MLYRLLILLACLVSLSATAQQESLYFFCNKDSSKVGVGSKSRVIIPAEYGGYSASCGDKVETRLITLIGKSDTIPNDSLHYTNSFKVFNRKGEFLYSPYIFDNGPDYFREGARRFVEGQKMGLVDRFGNKIIPATYNYIEPPYHGYILACLDCKYVRYSADEEHCCQIAGKQHQILERNGKVSITFPVGGGMNDSLYNAFANPPPLSPQEKTIVQRLRANRSINRALKHFKAEYETIYPIVAELPSIQSPYFLISFHTTAGLDELTYLISKDGKTIKQLTDGGEEVNIK